MRITVVGTGYVGLVTGTCFSETGNQVLCVDIDASKVERMQKGEIPIYEPQLDVYFERNIEHGRLGFTTSLEEGVEHGDIIFLALPTPQGADGAADLSAVLEVAEQIGELMPGPRIVVDKSTVPVGTADRVRETIAARTAHEVDVASNPEFLREGLAVEDFMKPERVIIGTRKESTRKVMEDLYKPFVRSGNPIMFMDERSAELTKYAANAFLATKISFMNEIANLCQKVGADVDHVRMGMGTDSRIGKRFLFPGIGYGGSCFPKDVQALARSGDEYGVPLKILSAVMEVNEAQKTVLVQRIKERFPDIQGMKFGLWGLAFKPDTDDIREAPALYMIEELLEAGALITAYDPEAMENVRERIGDRIAYVDDPYETARDQDALIIATEWAEFRNPEFDKLKEGMQSPIIFDGRNLYELDEMRERGFEYHSIGRSLEAIPTTG
jgi:UDPglucose 6-dehydrogenase